MLRYHILPVTPLQQNCTLLQCAESDRGVVVDPGGEIERIVDFIARHQVTVERILLTHGHFDHAGGAHMLASRLSVPVEGPHMADRFLLESLPEQCRLWNLPTVEPFVPDRWLEEGDTIIFGNQHLAVLHCPGHTPGHVAFFHAHERLAVVGDILFRGSIGRTDFPRSDHSTLIHSIREKLLPLGDEIRFIPGHGPLSTFGEERQHNPFLY